MANIDNLAATALQVYQETDPGDNTHIRVGGLLMGIVEELGSLKSSNSEVVNIINNGGGYNDQELKNQLAALRDDLNNILNRERGGIEDMIENILNGKGFVDGWKADWIEELKAYLISVGVLGENGEDRNWSYILTKVNELEAAVNEYLVHKDANGNLIYSEFFQSYLHGFIENDTVITELKSRYAMTDSEQKLIKWLEAGLHQEVNANKAFSEVFVAAEDYEIMQSAISRLKTEVEVLDGKYKALANLSAKVDSLINNDYSMAGVITEASLGEALATLFAETSTDGQRALAAITAKVKDQISEIEISADVIRNISQQYVIQMEKLIVGNHNFYMHTLDNGLGFEMLCSGNVSANGNVVNYTEPCSKIRMYYNYIQMSKLSCDHIIMSNGDQGEGGGYSDIQVEKGMSFRWFNNVYCDSENKYQFSTELGSIVFDAGGVNITMPTGRTIKLNGVALHTA